MAEQKQSIPPPPEPELAVRTMESDIKSIKQSGGQAPAAEILNAPTFSRREEISPASQAREEGINIPGYVGPEKAIFAPIAALPETPREATPQASQPRKSPNFLKLILILIGMLIVIAGFGLLGYYVVFPWLFS